MSKLLEILQPGFVLRNSVYSSLLIGAVVPLAGAYLVIGRKTILALALPQISTLGVALTLWVGAIFGVNFAAEQYESAFFLLALAGGLAAMAGFLTFQIAVERRLQTPEDAETGAAYAVASAATLAFAASRIVPELGMLDVLKGEILAVPGKLLLCQLVVFVLTAGVLYFFRRPLHFVLYDPVLAFSFGLPSGALSVLIAALISAIIAVGGLCAGPLTIFAFLVLPPLTFLPFVKHMRQMYLCSVGAGILCAFCGFWLSYSLDETTIPVGSAQILLLGAAWIASRSILLVMKGSESPVPSIPAEARESLPERASAASSSGPLIELRDVSYSYPHGVNALEHVNFSVEEGEFLGLIGPNGGGKSTLLKIILGLLDPGAGEVLVFNRAAATLGRDRRLLGYVPQDTGVRRQFPGTVHDVVLMGCYASLGLTGAPGKRERDAARDAIHEVGLGGLEGRLASRLSGGQQQRMAIARALAAQARLLILDEPSSSLDTGGQTQLFALLKHLRERHRLTTVMVSHDLRAMLAFSDQLACLNRTIFWHGRTEQVDAVVLEKVYGCKLNPKAE